MIIERDAPVGHHQTDTMPKKPDDVWYYIARSEPSGTSASEAAFASHALSAAHWNKITRARTRHHCIMNLIFSSCRERHIIPQIISIWQLNVAIELPFRSPELCRKLLQISALRA